MEKWWYTTGCAGFGVYKFALKRLPDQPPPPWAYSEVIFIWHFVSHFISFYLFPLFIYSRSKKCGRLDLHCTSVSGDASKRSTYTFFAFSGIVVACISSRANGTGIYSVDLHLLHYDRIMSITSFRIFFFFFNQIKNPSASSLHSFMLRKSLWEQI